MSYVRETFKAVYFRLLNNLEYNGAPVPVFDEYRQGTDAGYPYCYLERIDPVKWDTKETVGEQITVTLNVFSRYQGMKELQEIMDLIDGLLHRHNFVNNTINIIGCDKESHDAFVDADGKTRHGVMRYFLTVDNEV